MTHRKNSGGAIIARAGRFEVGRLVSDSFGEGGSAWNKFGFVFHVRAERSVLVPPREKMARPLGRQILYRVRVTAHYQAGVARSASEHPRV